MKRLHGLLVAVCGIALVAALPAAAVKSIGIVKSLGDFRVDGSTIRGNSSVFEGDVIETTAARSTVQLAGTELTLLPDSTAKVYAGRTILQKGSGMVKDGANHVIEVGSLQVTPSAKEATVTVQMTGPKTVTVSAEGGGAQVRNSAGILVASLRSGMALAFAPQPGATTTIHISGTVENVGGRFYVTDKTTNVRYELQGQNLAKYVGQNVRITGSPVSGVTATGGASQVVQVSTVDPVSPGAAGAAGGAAGGHAVRTVAIVGGVAVGGTIGGLAGAGVIWASNP